MRIGGSNIANELIKSIENARTDLTHFIAQKGILIILCLPNELKIDNISVIIGNHWWRRRPSNITYKQLVLYVFIGYKILRYRHSHFHAY
jgi:hypothetical protein